MKWLSGSFLLACALLATGAVAANSGPVPIAVVDFTASTRTPYQTALAELVVDELVNSGEFDVLEREKLESVIGEVGFQAASGFVSPDSAVQVGNMLGAKLLVTGHVLEHAKDSQRYTGYGVTTTRTTYRLKARLEVIDVTSGSKLFSHVAESSKEVQAIQGHSTAETHRDLGAQVANQLVAAMLRSTRVRALVDGPEGISVTIRSTPAEADLEVDGTFYGATGEAVDLVPGLHSIRVTAPGYDAWEKRVMVREGSKIVARLQKTQQPDARLSIEVTEPAPAQ